MLIYPAMVPEEGLDLAGDEEIQILDPADKEPYRVEGPVHYKFHVQHSSGELIVTGAVTVDATFQCSRCGEAYRLTIGENRFLAAKEAPDRSLSVDLTEDIREAILCAFPSHPLCKPDCRGLCSVCGNNRNRKKCSCKQPKENAWDALSKLKLN